jgi:hypothetical protein
MGRLANAMVSGKTMCDNFLLAQVEPEYEEKQMSDKEQETPCQDGGPSAVDDLQTAIQQEASRHHVSIIPGTMAISLDSVREVIRHLNSLRSDIPTRRLEERHLADIPTQELEEHFFADVPTKGLEERLLGFMQAVRAEALRCGIIQPGVTASVAESQQETKS